MALSTLRCLARPSYLSKLQCSTILIRSSPMASSAHEEMKAFWKKNAELNRPSSPWTIYMPHLPMMTSLTHRTTGIIMGVALYCISVDLFLAAGNFSHYVDVVAGWQLNPALMFTAKSLMAFPLVYHYINGIRHLTWDAGRGFEMKTQYKSGWAIVTSAVILAATCGAISYII